MSAHAKMSHMKYTSIYGMLCLAFCFLQCTSNAEDETKGSAEHIRQITEAIDDQAIIQADNNQEDWLTYGGNYAETRYRTLDQINKTNLNELGLAWAVDLGTKRGIQATPLVVDGIMFLTGPWSIVYAIDVRSGKRLWTFDPELEGNSALVACCGVINRGLAIYKGDLFLGVLDGRLMSIDAATGEKNWEINTVYDETRTYSITGAPRIADGKVLIGNGGAEFDTRGYVTAYDTSTGEEVWRFFTVPGNPAEPFEHPDLEEAAKTWTGEWWKQGGGGTAWDAITYDPELNQVYIGVGNGTHWNRKIRSPEGGDNLYLSSIVAVDASDGSYKWHYQTTPGDTWDYTATQHIVQADIEIDGQIRQVLMQAPKNGFFYVIDRTNGEYISAEPFVYMNWATGIDDAGRPIEAEGARYDDGRMHWLTPGSHGGHNWTPMSYDKDKQMMYIPTANQSGPYADMPFDYDEMGGAGSGLGANISMGAKIYYPPVIDPKAPLPSTSSGALIAWDPIQQKKLWSVDQLFHYNGGVVSTSAGLVMQGDAEGMFYIRDADTGEELWKYDVRSGVIAAPITYMVDGEQYITIAVGWGGSQGMSGNVAPRVHPGTVYTFKLGGEAAALEKLPPVEKQYATLGTDAPPVNIGEGFNLYMQYCMGCHMNPGTGGGAIPDLTMSSHNIFDNYEQIVLEGILETEGMPNLGEYISKEELADIRSFVLHHAQQLGSGKNPNDVMVELAGMQYLADQNPPKRKDIR